MRSAIPGTCAIVMLLLTVRADATVFVPMRAEDLARGSVAAVIGTVTDVHGIERHGQIRTQVDIAVEQTVFGDETLAQLTLEEPGGVVGTRREVVFGSPAYEVGEHVLVFMNRRGDGSLRTTQLALGKYHLETDPSGAVSASLQIGAGAVVLQAPGAAAGQTVALDDLRQAIRRVKPPPGPLLVTEGVPVQPGRTPPPSEGGGRGEVTAAFTLLRTARFFEPDEGIPLPFVIDSRGDALLGLDVSRQAVDDALAVWSDVATATIELTDDGLTGDLSAACPGPNVVRFDDPDDEMPAPVNCTGTLAAGGFCSTDAETKVFNGTTFGRVLRARLTFADGWNGCAVWTACNVAEIATHELGHAIGIGHSSERPFESDPRLRDATMYYLAHFDGRCAALRLDDTEAVSFLYPTAIPPTITTATPLQDAVAFVPYSVTLAVDGGSGPYQWYIAEGDVPGLSLSPDGVLSGTPRVVGAATLRIRVTDRKGDSHTKQFDITLGMAPTATPITPPPPTPTVPAPSCSGDCNGDSEVTVNELITSVNISLGAAPLGACAAADTNGDGEVTVNEVVQAVNAALEGCGGAARRNGSSP